MAGRKGGVFCRRRLAGDGRILTTNNVAAADATVGDHVANIGAVSRHMVAGPVGLKCGIVLIHFVRADDVVALLGHKDVESLTTGLTVKTQRGMLQDAFFSPSKAGLVPGFSVNSTISPTAMPLYLSACVVIVAGG